jgi:LPS-assembly protein
MPPAVPPYPRLLLSLCLAAASLEVFAAGDSIPLKASAALSPAAPKGRAVKGPTHVEADRLDGREDVYIEAEGNVIMRNLREQVEADWVRYDQPEDEAQARGHVVFTQDRDRLRGSELKLKLTPRLGYMKDVLYDMHAKDGSLMRGEAKVVNFQGPDRYQMENATYSTCPVDAQDWVLKMGELNLDYLSNLGSARHVRVEYLNTPILYSPWMDFSLDNSRKSGLLAPTYGATNERGLELIVPWYWNIAPNRDATITPRLMTRRGLQLGGEFRYLEPNYKGTATLELLPDDRVANRSRYLGMLDHRQQFAPRWSGFLHYERVSDNTYFTDLSSVVSQTSRVNLLREGNLAYDGGWWRAAGRVQEFQTLQDPAAPVVAPYQRLPQLTLNARQDNLTAAGLNMDFSGEFVNFNIKSGNRVQGSRLYAYPSISLPIDTPYSTFTPRLGWHLTRYALDDGTRNLADSLAAAPAGGFTDTTRSLPTFSLDSSLFFEREIAYRGRSYNQTLEPRAYYVYIPYKDQTGIPIFDSGASDLSLDQTFRENQFVGVDRINDANQITLAVTSRILEQGTGRERLQFTLGQRYYFSDQRVTLPGVAPRGSNTTDLLGQVSGQVNDKLRLSSGIQVNTDNGQIAKANLGGSWRDGPGRLFNADYRYTHGNLNQIDLSTQWPLAPRWHGLGRVNYSIEETRLVEALAGFEYNAGCWSLRGMMQRLATSQTTASNAIYLQLELHGLTKLGPNPLDVLKRSITGYVPTSNIAQPESSLPY